MMTIMNNAIELFLVFCISCLCLLNSRFQITTAAHASAVLRYDWTVGMDAGAAGQGLFDCCVADSGLPLPRHTVQLIGCSASVSRSFLSLFCAARSFSC